MHNRNIEALSLKKYAAFKADMWMMAPPCQPFTRQGKQTHGADPRCKSLNYLIRVLREMVEPPTYILLENVKNFEGSAVRTELVELLAGRGYAMQEFLLSPDQFGVPNSRLRYFLVATRADHGLPVPATGTVLVHLPPTATGSGGGGGVGNGGSEGVDNNRGQWASPEAAQLLRSGLAPNDTEGMAAAFRQVPGTVTLRPWRRCAPSALKNGFLEEMAPMEMAGESSEADKAKEVQASLMTKTTSPYAATTSAAAVATASRMQEDDAGDTKKNMVAQDPWMPERMLCKHLRLMHVTTRESTATNCFTKGYSHYAEGTGSILQTISPERLDEVFAAHEAEVMAPGAPAAKRPAPAPCHCPPSSDGLSAASLSSRRLVHKDGTCPFLKLGFRFFTPSEIAALHGFPRSFTFPKDVTVRQARKCLGNSLSVTVVSELLGYLLPPKYIGGVPEPDEAVAIQ